VHRVIKALLGGKRYHLVPSAKTRGPPCAGGKPARRAVPSDDAELEAVGSRRRPLQRQRARADEASRDVEAWLKCRYMREHLGEEFAGTVSAVASFGLFVTLDALYVEGLVHITELGGEYYRFDEARQELRGERTGVRYAVGTRVRVQVSRVDLDGRKIDFRLVREGEAERLLAKGAEPAKPASRRSTNSRGQRGRPGRQAAAGAAQKARRRRQERRQGQPASRRRAGVPRPRPKNPRRWPAARIASSRSAHAHGLDQARRASIRAPQRARRAARRGRGGRAPGGGRAETRPWRLRHLRPQPADPAGQHVAGAGGGQQRRCRWG
jgi:ribonuclease R